MTIQIFNTDYVWNWLVTLNHFMDGVAFGAGIVLVFILFVLFINKKQGVNMGFKIDENYNKKKYDVSIVKDMQEKGLLPLFRIIETQLASGQFTYKVEVCPEKDVRYAGYLGDTRLLLLTSEEIDEIKPPLKKGEWYEFEKYQSYVYFCDHIYYNRKSKDSACKAIDKQIIRFLNQYISEVKTIEYP